MRTRKHAARARLPRPVRRLCASAAVKATLRTSVVRYAPRCGSVAG